MNNIFFLMMFAGTFFSAVSQVLLKESANQTSKKGIYVYLNWRVLLSYAIFFGVLLVNTYAYTKIDMKYGAIIDTFSYVFVLILSRLLLREKITKGKLIGNLIIIAGVIIYTLPD